jgi:hypothetical protein
MFKHSIVKVGLYRILCISTNRYLVQHASLQSSGKGPTPASEPDHKVTKARKFSKKRLGGNYQKGAATGGRTKHPAQPKESKRRVHNGEGRSGSGKTYTSNNTTLQQFGIAGMPT